VWSCAEDIATELASLTLLAQVPRYFLLTNFYAVPAVVSLASLGIELANTVLPISLARYVWETKTTPKTHIMNESKIITLSTTVCASMIYSLAVYISLHTWLPAHLAVHFDGLKDLSYARTVNTIALMVVLLPVGYAARRFVLVPAASYALAAKAKFDPKAATLKETVAWNFWVGFTEKTKVIIHRTAVVILVGGLNTWIQTAVTLEGVDNRGGLDWALAWNSATAVVGLVFWWMIDI
jgi:hypothetical protein